MPRQSISTSMLTVDLIACEDGREVTSGVSSVNGCWNVFVKFAMPVYSDSP